MSRRGYFDIEECTFAQKGFNCSDHFTAATNSLKQYAN
jgi:hypothetical protein